MSQRGDATESFFASRAMQALEVLAFGPATSTQVATALAVHARTARRLLNRMTADGWLTRRDGQRPTYTPTLRVVALAAQLAARTPLVIHGADLAGELHARSGATVHLAVPSYRSALRLLRIDGGDGEPPAVRDLAPANAIAAGKLLLAYREQWRRSVLDAPLEAPTPRTLADAAVLGRALNAVRERGIATEDEEFRLGVRAIAAPVYGEQGDVVAALALSASRSPLDDLLGFSELLGDTADELSRRLAA